MRRERGLLAVALVASMAILAGCGAAPPGGVKKEDAATKREEAARVHTDLGQQYLRQRSPARWISSSSRKSRQSSNLFVAHCQFNRSPPSCHDAAPRFANRKTRNPPSTHRFHNAGFMESIV